MAFAEGLFALGLLAVLLGTWPTPPWNAIYNGGIGCWLAFDLLFRPPRPEDFEA